MEPFFNPLLVPATNFGNTNNLTDVNMATSQSDITWAQVGNCALAATGLDILNDIRTIAGSGTKITKDIAKHVFKKAVKKIASYATGAGVAITAGMFAWCLI